MKQRVLTAVVNVICVIAILLSLAVGWTVISTPRGQAPKLFGLSFMRVLTGSMEPTIPENSLVVVRTADPASVKEDDVISFYAQVGSSQIINTHRVVEVIEQNGQTTFRTQGDANAASDPSLVSDQNLVGRVVFHSHILGVIVTFLCKPYIFLPLVLIPLMIIIFTYGRRIVRLARREIAEAARELEEDGSDEGK